MKEQSDGWLVKYKNEEGTHQELFQGKIITERAVENASIGYLDSNLRNRHAKSMTYIMVKCIQLVIH
jgi:hypothetical protein